MVDDGDGFPGGAPVTLAIPGLAPGTPYDTDPWTLAIPVDPMIPPAAGLIFSLDDADPGPGVQAFFSADFDTPAAGLDPGDIYTTGLNGFTPAMWCDDVTQMGIAPNEATPVDLNALTVVPPAYCAPYFGVVPWFFLFSVDDVPVSPGWDLSPMKPGSLTSMP